uniref:C2H2-type domain-containing protein n=1 Tax=viral metagenome TaxID=1070528 RepID=A0A6C0KF78_9ZZZZ
MDCDFCKKTFSSKSNLYTHQNTAKFCLELQGKQEENGFECEFCKKKYAQKKGLILHNNICNEKDKKTQSDKHQENINRLESEIIKLKRLEKDNIKKVTQSHEAILKEKNEYIAKLEAKLEKFENAVTNMAAAKTLAIEAKAAKDSQPVTNNTTNNITVTTTNNNVLNLSQEHVKSVLTEHLDYNVVYAGQAGLATFVVDKILKNQAGTLIYRCVDPSRQMFEFENENGETVRDMKAEKLIQSLVKGEVIKIGLEQAGKGWNTDDSELNTKRAEVFSTKVNEYANLNRNNTVFRSKVSSLTT